MNGILFSHKSDEYATPQSLFDELNAEFSFNLDPCATKENHKCEDFYTIEQDGLSHDWEGRCVFCNPPYSRIAQWVRKCYEEAKKPNTTVVMLIPARTDTRYFHDYIYHHAEIRFIKGRLRFNDEKKGAPFPSMVVIYKHGLTRVQVDDFISRRKAVDRINKQREHLQPEIYPQDKIGDAAYRICAEFIERLPPAQPDLGKYEYHYDHTDCIWYRPEARNRCPVTCAQYRDGWNDAMNYIFRDGKGYRPYRRDKQYEE